MIGVLENIRNDKVYSFIWFVLFTMSILSITAHFVFYAKSIYKMHKVEYKTLWISDIHLGTTRCQIENIKYVLDNIKAQNIY